MQKFMRVQNNTFNVLPKKVAKIIRDLKMILTDCATNV
jgi:hypothetical protein